MSDFETPASFTIELEEMEREVRSTRDAVSGPGEDGAPRAGTEATVAAVWSEILRLPKVGRHDSFFHLGGQSVTANRVINRLRDALGVDLPMSGFFAHPTVAALAAWIDAARRGPDRSGTGPEADPRPIRRLPRDEPLPLSFMQERLWFLDRLERERAIYNMPFALRLSGRLDRSVLERGLNEIVRRHEVLRTVYASGPVQIVEPFVPRPLPVADLRGLPAEHRDEEAGRCLAREESHPFALERDPMLRWVLLRLDEDSSVLLLTLHHIAGDGWSVGILISELAALVEAFSLGLPSPLPELPVQYADFAAWQRKWLAGSVLERQIAWWKEELTGAPTLLELPADRPRLARQSFRGAESPASVPPEVAGALRVLARRETTSPFIALLAVFQTLLSRSTGQDDLLVGTPVANRRRREVERLIGFFVNTLVMRGRFGERQTSFRQLLRRMRGMVHGAFSHQDLPFERLVEELRVERSLAYNPLFQVMFAFNDGASLARELPGLSWSPLSGQGTVAKFDLALNLTDSHGDLAGIVEYATDLFDVPTIERLTGHFRVLLAGAVAAPDAPLADLPLLSEEERRQLTVWSRAEMPDTWGAPVHRLFERQAERSPEAPAVTFGAEMLSYAELNRRAGQLAAQLRRLGVGAESRVGLLLERSLDLAAGILGIWKAGGAYVPLDPSLPDARLAWVIEDAFRGLPSPVLLAQKSLENRVAALPVGGARVAWLGDESGGVVGLSEASEPGALAYLIYTSGSTGQPKAVQVEHGNLAHTLRATQRRFEFAPGDRMPCLAPFSFDIFLLEMFGPLLAGGTVVIHPLRPTLDLPRLVAELSEMTLLHAVPALMRQVVERLERQGNRPPLRRVFVGGDAVPADLLGTMRSSFPEARVTVLYGPTEATIIASSHEATGTETGMVLGRPLPGAVLELRDRAGYLVPIGVPGEVWLGGPGVTRGYLHRPELTAETFVAQAGERFYRTGDLGRRLTDGTVEFLGRVDRQVKVRGFRVELGEIESALLQQYGVRQAAVLARREEVSASWTEPRLTAYVVAGGPSADLALALREGLRQRLPEYMIPAAWVFLEELPLTSHGKIDRRALARIEAESGEGYVAPRTPTEEVLAGLWAGLLGVERVGARDDFFQLGGHSLLATRLVSRVGDALGVELSLQAIFEAPILGALAVWIDEALRRGAGLELPPIQRVPRNGTTMPPLSFAQERLWFLDRLDPDQAVYNMPFALRLTGSLDLAALERSWNEILRRHEVLRAAFPEVGGAPEQAISPSQSRPLPVVDLRGLSAELRENEAGRRLAEEGARPFELARGPVMRAVLLRLEEGEAILLLNLHHIASDGWSMGVLTAELTALVEAFSRGLPSPLLELPVQYADFAVWQRRWLAGEALERQIAWWREELAGAPTLLDLPTDRPRPACQSFQGAESPMSVPPEVAGAVRALARREGASAFMVLLAAFQTLLQRSTGQDDLLVGTPIANRRRREVEGLIGLFVNTLVMRGRFGDGGEGALSFRRHLRRVRGTALGAYTHQDVPFERLVEELRVERSLAHNPLFQVMFALQDGEPLEREMPGLTWSPLAGRATVSKFDLELTLMESAGELVGGVGYATDLFDAPTIERLTGHFRVLLAGAVAAPDAALADLPLLSEEERGQLTAWSRSEAPDRWGAPVHRLFERQAERTPEAPAVTFGAEMLSYAELNHRAGQLAAHLRRLGVGPESRVGLLLERSLDLAAGILGIWKAGGAYVPLDPSLPDARLAWLVEDAFRGLPAPVLVAQKGLEDRVAALPVGARVAWLGDESGDSVELSEESEPGALAYLIYTSGTTGRPKAVQVEHGSLAHTLRAAQRVFEFAPGDRMPCLAPFSFDIFLLEMFGPLLAGGTVVIHPLRPTLDLPRLVAELPEMTLLHAVPALMRQVVEELERQGSRPPLRRVFVGGDAVPADLLTAMRSSFPAARVTVLYGPTEATIIASSHEATGAETGMVLGRPLPGTVLELRDRAGHLVPIGVPGEVWLGGPGVTRGYLHRPELTAETFVAQPGERFYRTGDLGRRLADGTVEFLGRVDHQVKVRGFRVELGEIESALLQLGGVRQAAVLVRRDGVTESRLVAYVVSDKPGAGGPSEDFVSALREGLRRRLPEYMVPAFWVFLEELPLTSHGKVDRRALAKIEPETESGAGYVAPHTPTEEMLTGVWTEVLGIPRVGARDNFFELGGHSLLATRVASRLRDAFSVEVPLRILFEAPALAALAERIDALRAEGNGLRVPPIRPVPRAADQSIELPLSFSQERFWFFEQLEPGNPLYNLTAALGLSGVPSPPVLATSFNEIVRRHEALRTRFVAREGRPFQRVIPRVSVALPVIDLGGLPAPVREPEARRLLGDQTRKSFDLARGGLIDVGLIRVEETSWLLLLSLHHIISDAWSTGVLIGELAALYRAFSQGLPSPLPELPVQYADFADWQRRWLSGSLLTAEVDHWQRALEGAPKLVDLPSDRPRPPLRSLRGGLHPVTIPDELASRLRGLSREGGATLFMTLLSAFLALLWRHTGQEDLLVGTPIAGRNRSETEGLIGCFINTLVLRGRLEGGRLSFREMLRQIRATTLDAYLHQDLPLEKVIEALQVQGSVAYNPLIQVMFALQNAPLADLDLPGMKLRIIESESEVITNFDLNLGFTDVLGGLWGGCMYRTDLFDGGTIERLLGRYLQILEGAVDSPDRPLTELPPWGEPARVQVLAAAAATAPGAEEKQEEETRARLAAREEKVAGMRSALSDKKRAALARMIRNRAAASAEAAAPREVIPRRPDPDSAVLSFSQERLWFLDRFESGSPLYNISFALRLTGRLDPAALRRSLGEIVRRHEALRTTFAEVDGEPRQIIHPARPLPLPVVDLRGLPGEAREMETRRQVQQESLRPCDLALGPLFRGTLLRLDAEEWAALFTLHHIVSDAWSSGILVRELAALYRAFSLGERPLLPELPIQYADFAHWQRQWLAGEVLATQLSSWKTELAGAPTVLELPTDRPRTANPSSRGGQRAGRFTPAASQAMRALAEREGATLFMVMLAAYQALLFRTTGQDDVLVGSPIANRSRPEVEGLIGFFLNTLVLRARLLRGARGESTFRELLRRVKASALEAYAHQDVPFERLVEELQVERSLTHNPLFQTMFVLQEGPAGGQIDLPGAVLEPMPPPGGLAKFDLSLGMAEIGGELEGMFEYSTALFDDTTIDRLLAHALELVAGVAADPDRPLTEVPLLSGPERHQILAEWNDTRTAAPGEALLHERFAAQVARTPDAPALEDEAGRRLTYRELDGWAERVASRLRHEGVGPEVPVGVFLERSPELIVALLATLKAGGAYLPLDPAYPADRLVLMLEDSGAPVVLTEDRLREALPASGARPVSIGETGANGNTDSVEGPAASPPHPENLAYVLYTSGSTGRPKGVGVDHRAAVAHMETVARLYELGPEDRVLQFASPSFDTSLEQILPPLLRGATVVLRGRDLWEPAAFLPRIAELGLTMVNPPTAYWHQWAHEGGRSEPLAAPAGLRLRLVLVGGEAMTAEAARLWGRLPLDGVRLLNGYGPTETVVTATLLPMEGRPAGQSGSVGIGRPLPGRTAVVLDREGHPAPAGVPGELCLGGVVGRGYLGRPDLTAERFVPDPFAALREGGAESRLYRTGDLVRWRADGTLEFLGRIDQQVKVRGFRIELGEIESVLARHPAVREVAVILLQEGGDRRLVACVTRNGEVSPEELRAHLRAHLPEHMVPAAFVLLAQLPLTPNGKVDRRTLARLAAAAEEGAGAAPVAPRNPTEELLAGLWADLLRVERVGVHDDFFELGGHSLLATRLASRLRSVFGVDLALRLLFEHSNLANQAERIDRELRQVGRIEAPPITSRSWEEGAAPLSFAQERLWFLDRLEPGNITYNLPVALRLTGTLDVAALERTFREIVRRHDALRTTFAEIGGEPRQIVAPVLEPDLPVTDLRDLPADARTDAARWILGQWVRSFDLERGPLVRFGLLRIDTEEWMLLADMHHIVSDGWSMGVLVRETAALYESFLQGLPSPLPELPIQYPDFAVWQRRWLSGEVLETQLAWWREELAGAPAVLELPTDRPRPAVRTARGGVETLVLPEALSTGAAALGRRENATPFMVLLAAFQALLYRYTGQPDLPVGTVVANRNRSEIEGLIGFFVNTLVLRGRVGGRSATFAELLRTVRSAALGAYAHQDLPFERLVEELHVTRSLSHNPLFQVMFVLQNLPLQALELPGLRLEPVAGSGAVAKFDLSLTMSNRNGALVGDLDYSLDLFEVSTVRRLLGHFQVLLEGAMTEPGRPLSGLPLLTEAEQRELLLAADPGADLGAVPAATLADLLAAQAARRPDAPAVEAEDGPSLTCRELDAWAGRLAARLRREQVGPEVPVGVFLERSPELVVALLGCLKSGGVYLPLDPMYPPERLAFMLEDSGAPVVLTTEALVAALPPSPARPVLLGSLEELPAVDGPGAGASPIPPESLAYLLYTSGSTGRPKGVGVGHRAAAEHMASVAGFYGLTERDRVLQFASPSFDTSLEQILPALLAGATVVLRGRDLWEPALFSGRIAELGLTVINPPTAYWHQWVQEQGRPAALPLPESLRLILVGGEAMAAEAASDWERLPLGGVRLLNAYGPTETVVTATFQEVGAGGDGGVGRSGYVSIGRPLPGRTACVLDVDGNLVPPGVPGELCLGGVMARGYLGRPDLTAEKFVPDPFAGLRGGAPGERLYRTGDLVRAVDGSLDFLGRVDHQIKVRGFRIELGEIEAVLARHPAVREAVVLVTGNSDDHRLIAFVVGDASPEELRAHLRGSLPEYMVPSAVVTLLALPLMPNGKVDRRALAASTPSSTRQERTRTQPRTPTEELLAGVWADLLGLERVGLFDDFFELGGHSLLATRLVSRLRTACGIELPLRAIFESPVLADLAERIEREQRQRLHGDLPLIAVRREGTAPLSFAQEGLWFLHRLAPESSAYNLPVTLRLGGSLEVPVLRRTLAELIRRHESLRTTFVEIDGEPRQVTAPVSSTELPELPVGDLRHLPAQARETEAERLVAEEMERPYDLEKGPLLRVHLLRLADAEWLLQVDMHHIVSDGWSMEVLVRETAALYAAFLLRQPSPLPELPIQYADFAIWQRQWLTGEVLETQISYWLDKLAGAPPVLKLPIDRPRPPIQSSRGGLVPLEISRELLSSLRTLVRSEGVTPFMLLLATFQSLLHLLSGQDDVLVGSPVANRGRSEIEGLVGFFVNTLVLRGHFDADRPSFRQVLARARATALEAYAHQDLPFELLVQELRLERSLSHSQLFQAMLAYQSRSSASLELPGLSLAPVEVASTSAKFDLILTMAEMEDGVEGTLTYSTDLFDPTTARRMTRWFLRLLAGALAEPDRPVAELPLFEDAERFQFLVERSDGAPSTAKGEVDREALPRTPTEQILASLWADLLRCEPIGVRDNFFELGGHSLLATRLVSRLRAAFEVELPLRVLFELPVLADLAARIDRERRRGEPTAPPLLPVSRATAPPLSFGQERLWFLDRLQPGSPAYNMPVALRLSGSLDVPALHRTFAEIVRRHEALRTTFAEAGGEPRQIIAPPGLPELPITDLRALPETAREGEAARWIAAEVVRPFDLEQGPLLRLSLLRLADDAWLLSANMHHIVSDGWSMEVLIREAGALYAAFSRNLPSPLPELAIQYADFAAWQRRWLAGEVLEAQLSYWRRELAGAPALLELPTDRPRSPVRSFRGAVEPLTLPGALSRDLRDLARREGVTLFMILLAAFQMLLHRLAGQDDVLVGSPVANRNRSETEGLIGFFVNPLVLRGRFGTPDGGPGFRETLSRTRVAALGAYAHQDLPFERLVEELQVERSLSHSPLFQVVFALQNLSLESLELPGLRLSPVPMQGATAKFDLTLSVAEGEDGLEGTLEYSSELFDAATMRRLLDQFRILLEGALAEPARPVSELPLLGEAERFQLAAEWNDTARTRSSSPLVHELVAAQARLRPQATAVVSRHGRLSYGDLAARANRLSHLLRSLGVGPEARVAVCLERSPERVVAALGVLAAGGSYVSLDPDHPPERLAFLLADSRCSVLLTGTRLREALPATGAVVLCLDADPDPLAGQGAEPLESGVTPANPAYVIYTSGSTGQPKGIEIPHAGLLNLVLWHLETYRVTPDDRAAQVASPAFDASVWELWPYLAAGAELHIPDEETRLSAAATLRWWTEEGITLAFLPTPLAEAVLEEPAPPDLELRALLTGGDRLHRAPGPEWPFRLVNHYGPAECGVVTTAIPVPPGSSGAGSAPPIGRAIDGVRVHVLDRAGEPVPIGGPGELHIGGAGLARGYLGRPDLTAAAFLPSPLGGVPGARLYRTGDRVRWRPDGQLDFLGRLDHQVKVRGVRIELGEIEAVLGIHPAVQEAAVLVREDRPGAASLVAWLVAHDPVPTAGELRVFLRERLPEAMVPASFIVLDSLPLTPNGKVDRQALAALAPEAGGEDGALVPPRDPLEEILAGIWSDLLEREQVGIHDDFFALGGHSLLAVSLMAKIRQQLGCELPLTALFQGPTIEALAALLRRGEALAPSSVLVPIQPRGPRRPLFCVHPVGGDVLCFAPLARHLGTGQPLYGLRSRGLAGEGEPLRRIEEMAALYIGELRRIQPEGPYQIAGWSLGGLIAFEMARQLRERGLPVALLAILDGTAGSGGGMVVDDLDFIGHVIADIESFWRKDLGITRDVLAALSPEARLEFLAERLRAVDVLPPGAGPEQLARILAVYRANVEAASAYEPGIYPDRITVLRAGATPSGTEGIPPGLSSEPDLGWSRVSTEPVEVHTTQGTHFTLLTEPDVQELARQLALLLDRTGARLA